MSDTLDDTDSAYQPLDIFYVDTALTGVISSSLLYSSARAGATSDHKLNRITSYNLRSNCRIFSSPSSTNNHGSNESINSNESNESINDNESNKSTATNESNELVNYNE